MEAFRVYAEVLLSVINFSSISRLKPPIVIHCFIGGLVDEMDLVTDVS